MVFNLIEQSHMEKVIDVAKTATHADMVESYDAEEQVFDGFLGGVEVPVEDVKEETGLHYYEFSTGRIIEEEDEIIKLPAYISLDGKKAAARICQPVSLSAWYGISNDIFYLIADAFGVDNLMTKSEFQTELEDKYIEKQEE